MHRRRALAALACAALLPAATAAAQTPAPLRYALLSAVGDQMTIVHARTQTGSRLDRNDREHLALPERALDRLALKHLDGALKRTAPSAEVAALAAASGRLLDVQREMLSGHKPPETMAKVFAEALPAGGADRLLLIVKHRAEANIPVTAGSIGLGRLEGVGFYVDRVTVLRSTDSGYLGTGFLAPFAYVRLILADGSGRVLAQRDLAAAESYNMADAKDGLQPWDIMDAAAKVNAVDRLLQREIEREVPKLFTATKQ